MLGEVLLDLHNQHHYLRFFAALRASIASNAFPAFAAFHAAHAQAARAAAAEAAIAEAAAAILQVAGPPGRAVSLPNLEAARGIDRGPCRPIAASIQVGR